MIVKKKPGLLAVLMITLFGLLAVTVVLAQTSSSFYLSWNVTGGGGGSSSSSSYQMDGTIGQGFTSPPWAASSNFVVSSGYWFSEVDWTQYLPVVRND